MKFGIDAVAQNCKTATKMLLNEAVLNQGQGIPFRETVWIGTPNYSLFKSFIRSTLLGIEGVLDVGEISLLPQNGNLDYTVTIKTIYGVAVING